MSVEAPEYRESHIRSLLKALSWRVVATTTTAVIAWFITGEVRKFSGKTVAWGRTKPKANFWTGEGGKGAWEIAFRYSTIDLTDAGVVGGEQDTMTFGVNWYWNPNVRMVFNYIYADITDGVEGSGKLNIVAIRWQFDF